MIAILTATHRTMVSLRRHERRDRRLRTFYGLSVYHVLLLALLLLAVYNDKTMFSFCNAFSISATRTPRRSAHAAASHQKPFLLSDSVQRYKRLSSALLSTLDGASSEDSESMNDVSKKNVDSSQNSRAGVDLPQDPSRRGRSDRNVGGYDPSERLGRGVDVGDPQIKVKEKERSVTSILKELAAIQQQGPQKYCILGTRHCSFLHQQIIELLAYALVLSGNHVYTSGAGGTHAATIRGALRAERDDLLTVVLPQSMGKQTKESQELLKKVDDVITMPQNDEMSLDIASRICNSYLLSQTDQLISFAFHESTTVIEATKEAKKLDLLVTVLYLD